MGRWRRNRDSYTYPDGVRHPYWKEINQGDIDLANRMNAANAVWRKKKAYEKQFPMRKAVWQITPRNRHDEQIIFRTMKGVQFVSAWADKVKKEIGEEVRWSEWSPMLVELMRKNRWLFQIKRRILLHAINKPQNNTIFIPYGWFRLWTKNHWMQLKLTVHFEPMKAVKYTDEFYVLDENGLYVPNEMRAPDDTEFFCALITSFANTRKYPDGLYAHMYYRDVPKTQGALPVATDELTDEVDEIVKTTEEVV